MAYEAQSPRALSGSTHGFKALVNSAATFGALVSAKAAGLVKRLQYARMLSTLAQMSDSQLEQIGIARSDIPSYAASLMVSERD